MRDPERRPLRAQSQMLPPSLGGTLRSASPVRDRPLPTSTRVLPQGGGGECDCQAICASVSGASADLDENNTFAPLIQTEVSTDRNDWFQAEYRYGDWSWDGSTHQNGTDPGAWLVGCDLYYGGSPVGTDTVKVGVSMLGAATEKISVPALDGNGLLIRSAGFYPVREFAIFQLAASVRLVAPDSHDRVFAGAWWSGWLWAIKVCGCGPGSFPVG